VREIATWKSNVGQGRFGNLAAGLAPLPSREREAKIITLIGPGE
jgi:hypothetical protein